MVKAAPGQVPLDFEPPKVRVTDPKTSRDASKSIRPGAIRALILNCLRQRPLATFQIAAILDKDRDSISPHMKPLENMGYIRRTGQTVKREKTNKECEVWELIPL